MRNNLNTNHTQRRNLKSPDDRESRKNAPRDSSERKDRLTMNRGRVHDY